jgi:DNA-binding transcriptional ArsR family regulator
MIMGSSVLKALADQQRWRIVSTLLEGERSKVTELAKILHVSQPNVSKAVKILREAGIVVCQRERTTVWCQVRPEIRRQTTDGGTVLDFGYCSFRFDQPNTITSA